MNPPTPSANRQTGFTLIELLVAISVMALMAVLSWRGLEGMARSQTITSQRADEVLTLQAGLGQWKVDLDALTQTPNITSLDWDGRVLRLTRRAVSAADGLVVVGWTRRSDSGQWLRWQSPAVRTVGGWNDAWSKAATWAQSGRAEDRAREVLIGPLEDWQIFYFRSDAWTNPLSSDGAQGTAGALVPTPTAASGTTSTASTTTTAIPSGITAPVTFLAQPTVPEGIRLVLTLPPGQAIGGKLTLDWVRPNLGGDKS